MVSRHVVTLANSIVGVSVLAMPFCFKQCGIVLATLSLMVGAVMTRMVCYFLLKAAVMNRRRTYEMLAWSTFGTTGKFLVEISIIGFLFGTLIAFMVVIGDLGPEILSEMFSVENNSSLRTIIMTALSLFVALPLGLLRNIDSLSSVSTASVLFYLFLVIKIVSEGFGPLWSGEYLERIHFWRSGGVLQCIPIFSMALSCQTQVFGIYDALPEPSLQKMNEVVKRAVYICTFFYFCVGFFGYIAFSHHNFGGNILLSFEPAWSTQLIKSMFLMSIVFSVPLVVFPCRASLHSLMFRSASAYHHVHDMSTNYIPESRLKLLTVTIVGATLVVGILIPNIELVLGLVGSTTGSVICIIFPSIMFVRVTSKSTTERLLAQLMFVIGVVLMLLTTYATLYAAEQTQIKEHLPEQLRVTDNLLLLKPIVRQDDVQLNSPISKLDDGKAPQIHRVEFEHKLPEKMISKDDRREKISFSSPRPKVDIPKKSERPEQKISSPSSIKSQNNVDTGQQPEPPPKDIKNTLQENQNRKQSEPKKVEQEGKREGMDVKPIIQVSSKPPKSVKEAELNPEQKPPNVVSANSNSKDIAQQLQNAANQNQAQGQGDDANKDFVDKKVAEEFLKRLEEHQENQKKLLAEQKVILEELKQHHAQDVREKNEKDKQKDENEKPVMDENNAEEVIKDSKDSIQPSPDGNKRSEDKMIQEQEKIIEKISENIEKENKNAKLLEKIEENLEGKLMNAQVNSNNAPGPADKTALNIGEKRDALPSKKDEVVVNPVNVKPPDTYHQAPKDDLSGNGGVGVLKGIDKEKGVLVGSLGAKLNNPAKSDTRARENQAPSQQDAVVKKVDIDKPNNVERIALSNSQRDSETNLNLEDHPNSNRMSNAAKENDQQQEGKIASEAINQAALHQAKAPVPSPSSPPPSKKTDSENVHKEKEKVDREM